MATQAQVEALLQRMRQMSDADLSVLAASTQTPGSSMTTGPGSANEALWCELVTLGWMAKRAEALDLPGGRRFEMTIYSISVEGLQSISDLLAAVSKR